MRPQLDGSKNQVGDGRRGKKRKGIGADGDGRYKQER
jgi:hypothetical protein